MPEAIAVVVPVNVVAAIAVLHVKPVFVVQVIALEAELHPGIANAEGDADALVAFASTVFAAIDAMPLSPTPPQTGAVDAPVETTACPLDELDGLSNWMGSVVAPKADDAKNDSTAAISLFMIDIRFMR